MYLGFSDQAQAAGSVLGPEGYDEDLPPGETGRKDYRLRIPAQPPRSRAPRQEASCARSPSSPPDAASRSG